MNRFLLIIIYIILSFIPAKTTLAQADVRYDFDLEEGLNRVETLSGSVEAVILSAVNDNGVANSTKLLHPKTVGSPNATGVAALTAFPSATDYSITWKEYLTQGNTTYKKGFLLRASGSGSYTTGIKRGYYFMVQNNATTGSVNFRIMNSSATGIADLKNSGAVVIPGFSINKACWFRASVIDNVLKFEYSIDGVNYTQGTSYTDGARLYTTGVTQLVFGIGSGVGQYYYDDIKFRSSELGNSSVSITGSNTYTYNAIPQGPKAATVTGSTGAITFSYSGTGSTFYGPSSTMPVFAGTYKAIASVAADGNYRSAVSDPFEFSINSNPTMPVVSLRRPVSPTSPMWLIHADVWAHQPQEVIDLIPEDIRPFVVINIALSTSILKDRGYDCAESWLNTCAQNGIWAMVQPSSGIENAFAADTAISAYESLYRKYPNFIGYNFCEQAWGFNSNTFMQRLNLFTSLLALSHKYGGYLYVNDSFSLSNAPFNSVSKFKTNSEFANATRVYKENMIYGDKFTSSWAYYDNESGALGAVMSGHAGNYAIRYDMYSWGWSGRGKVFGEETLNDRNPDGNRSLFGCPEAVMGIPIVEHMMMTGATVIDGPEVPWMSTFYRSYRLPAFDNMVADIFRKVLDGSIKIPTISEVASRTKVAFVNDLDVNTTDSLFSGLYAMDGSLKSNRTWFKKSGRYATIPQLYSGGTYETSLFTGSVLVKKSEYKKRWPSESDKINEFNSLYPAEYKGDMYVARTENNWFSYNPHINKNIVTRASIPLKFNTCDSISLSYPAHTFSVINESDNKLKVYLNNYRTDKNYLWEQYPNDFSWYTLQNTILPKFAEDPTDGTLRSSIIKVYGGTVQPTFSIAERGRHKTSSVNATWVDGVYTLTITHNGPVDLTINCSGSATGRPVSPANSALNSPLQPYAYAEVKQYEAEGGIVNSPAVISSSPKLYHGTGLVKFSSATTPGSSVKFKVLNIDTSGTYALDIRYSTVQGDVSKVDVLVNGLKVSTPIFAATATDSTWTIFTQKINLNAGSGNIIEFKANAPGAFLNIDKIYLSKRDFPFAFITFDAVQKNTSQIQLDWRVGENEEIQKYEVLKSTDGNNYTSSAVINVGQPGKSYYVYLDNLSGKDVNYYKIRATSRTGNETYSNVLSVTPKTAIPLQAELGTPGTDWETDTASGNIYITPKTDVANTSFPGNAAKVNTYSIGFEKPGIYDLYAKVWVGPGSFNDDSFYYGKGFGVKNPLADTNEWITCNGLATVGYTASNEVVGSSGNAGNRQWKWINISKFNGGEAPISFEVPEGALNQNFQIGGRENGLQLDKFVFGSSSQSFTVKELDSLAEVNSAPIIFASQSFNVSEFAEQGSSIGSIKAGDANKGTILRNWSIVSEKEENLFSIDSLTGTVKLAAGAHLDYERDTALTLSVTVSDGQLTSLAEKVTIVITNENDETPLVAPQQQFILQENKSAGYLVGKVAALDGDDKNFPGYTRFGEWKLTGGEGSFVIDSVTGEIRVAPNALLDFENRVSYHLLVSVNDGKFESAAEAITITLSNENDNPPILTAAKSYPIDGAVNHILGSVTSTDKDDLNQPGYSIISNWRITGGSGAGIFTVDSTGGIFISDFNSIDFKLGSYEVLISASDGLNESQPITVTISVPDKLRICHKGRSLIVSKNAVGGHLAHGCTIGSCGNEKIMEVREGEKLFAFNSSGSVSIFPNPIRDIVNIDFKEKIGRVHTLTILDLNGRIVLEQQVVRADVQMLNLAHLPSGIYLLRIAGDTKETFKLLKQ